MEITINIGNKKSRIRLGIANQNVSSHFIVGQGIRKNNAKEKHKHAITVITAEGRMLYTLYFCFISFGNLELQASQNLSFCIHRVQISLPQT